MAKVKIDKKEIEKMIKDQLQVKEVIWNKDGSCNVEIDIEDLKKKQVTIIKEEHYQHYPYVPIPIYIKPYVPSPYKTVPLRFWSLTTTKTSPIATLSYCKK